MANKRAKRIDPNEAFAAIVGNIAPLEPEIITPEPKLTEKAEGGRKTTADKRQSQATVKKSLTAPAIEPKETTEAQSVQQAFIPDEPQPKFEQLRAPGMALVQKGYYITEEQHKKLGLAAVVQETDRSAIVRAALDMYFAANKEHLP